MKRAMILGILLLVAVPAEPATGVEVVRIITGSNAPGGRAAAIVGWLTGRRERSLFERPYAVAWDGDSLLVADPPAGRVVRIDGRRIRATAEGALEQPVGVAACEAGIVVTDSGRGEVIAFDRELRNPRVIAKGIGRPTGVACRGPAIWVVATAEHRLLRLDAASGIIQSIGRRGEGAAEFNYPAAIAAGSSSLFVGDTLNFRLQELDLDTGFFRGSTGALGDGPGDTPRIKGCAVDASGVLWVTDAHRDRISLFAGDGRFLEEIGRRGSGTGEFSFPAGVAIAINGDIAVADSLNRRIQILRVTGDAVP